MQDGGARGLDAVELVESQGGAGRGLFGSNLQGMYPVVMYPGPRVRFLMLKKNGMGEYGIRISTGTREKWENLKKI